MGEEEDTNVSGSVEAAVAWLNDRRLDCVVIGVSKGRRYYMKSSVSKSYTWLLMDMAMAKLRSEIEDDKQFRGENQNKRKE